MADIWPILYTETQCRKNERSFPYHHAFHFALVFSQNMQHGIMEGREEDGGLNVVVEEHAAV